ncbi:MAG: lamin tail domain-containing protein [Alphaproteobacteria bacterium]|nr:lamin tail domain-containing protein [Alphaproteobacteria bacterium]
MLLSLLLSAAHATPPGPGDVVITEVMPAPRSQSTREWIELVNVSGQELDLRGCALIEGHDASGWTGNEHPLEDTCLDAGAELLLHRSVDVGACAAFSDTTGATCLAEVGYRYTSLSFGNSDVEQLCLVCGEVDAAAPCTASADIIDVVTVDWAAFEPACEAAQGSDRNCSIELKVPADADANDITSNWGVGEATYFDTTLNPADSATVDPSRAVGTPRNTNTCAPPEDTGDTGGGGDDTGVLVVEGELCAPGQVAFTELFPAPRDGSYADEYIELLGVPGAMNADGYCQLYSCQLDQINPDTEQVIATLILDDTALPLSDGQYMLLRRGTSDDQANGVTYTSLEDARQVQADYLYPYNGFSLPSEDTLLRLSCDGVVVDEARMDWEVFAAEAEARCPWDRDSGEGGCSMNLGSWAEGGATERAEPLANWCIPQGPSEAEPAANLWEHVEPDGDGWIILGTPGEPGDCPQYNRPAVGEVIFTEVMADGAGTEDWLELSNLVDSDKELTGCALRRYRLDEEGARDSEVEYVLGSDGTQPVLLGLASAAFAKDGCIDPALVDSGGEPLTSDCSFSEFSFGSISFTTSETEHLELVCPTADGGEELIDEIAFNWADLDVRDGHSMMYDPTGSSTPATDNDDLSAWCEAAFSQEFLEVSEGECNYGTPGAPGECLTDPKEYPVGGPACRCQSPGPSGLVWLLWALPLVGLRRRAEA